MGIVRFAQGSTRTEQCLCRRRVRGDAQAFEGGALPAQKRTQGRGSVCQRGAEGRPVIGSALESVASLRCDATPVAATGPLRGSRASVLDCASPLALSPASIAKAPQDYKT